LRLPWLLCWIASISMLGCQTSRSWEQGCPGVYSGIRYYGDQLGGLPVDGKIFFTLDLPLTAVADTLLLPVSVFMKPKRPKYGFPPWCTWAEKHQSTSLGEESALALPHPPGGVSRGHDRPEPGGLLRCFFRSLSIGLPGAHPASMRQSAS
jgi:uncharacterized protein YceK